MFTFSLVLTVVKLPAYHPAYPILMLCRNENGAWRNTTEIQQFSLDFDNSLITINLQDSSYSLGSVCCIE